MIHMKTQFSDNLKWWPAVWLGGSGFCNLVFLIELLGMW